MKAVILLLSLQFTLSVSGLAEGLFGPDSKEKERLIAERLSRYDKVVAEQSELAKELKTLRDTLPSVENSENRLKRVQSELAAAKNANPPINATITGLEEEAKDLQSGLAADKTSKEIKDRIAALEQDMKTKGVQIASIVSSLTGELTGEQSFKQTTSGYYALLIGVVIAGFFSIAFMDIKVRQAIFSGEAGIQFVTLFALVIAIILFGITGILEGKELSALLGGLSGYILGRTRTTGSTGTVRAEGSNPQEEKIQKQ
jgi:hypothetical protein